VSSSGRVLDFAGTREIEAAAVSGDSPSRQGGDAVRPALMSIGDIAHAAKDAFGDIDVGHLGLPEGGRYSDSARNLACARMPDNRHYRTYGPGQKQGGEIKNAYCTDRA
jgi:hypothetical protein